MWLGTGKEKVNKCEILTSYKLESRLSEKSKTAQNLGFVATCVSLALLHILLCIFFFFQNA